MKQYLLLVLSLLGIGLYAYSNPINPNLEIDSAPFFATAEFSPTDDAYLENSSRYNNNLIRLNQGQRVGYFKFDLSSISGTVTAVDLVLTVNSDFGNGTVTVYQGTSNNWTESNLSTSNAPGEGTSLATRSSSGSGTHTYNLSVSNPSIYSGTISFVLKHTGSDDLAYASRSHATTNIRPKLVVTYTAGGDTEAPSIGNLTSYQNTDTTVDLSWTPASDNVGVTGYEIYNYGSLVQSLGNVTDYQLTGLTPSTPYQFTLRAFDAAGNYSVYSNQVDITTDAPSGGGGGSGLWTQSGADVYYDAGNVGIGTAAQAAYKLAVDGSIHTKEVKVDIVGWADYVFLEEYPLPTLEEVQEYIELHGHLMNIPSAEEVEANGIELGEMNRLLLEKIEELTLYMLQLKQEINQLKNPNDEK